METSCKGRRKKVMGGGGGGGVAYSRGWVCTDAVSCCHCVAIERYLHETAECRKRDAYMKYRRLWRRKWTWPEGKVMGREVRVCLVVY